MNSEELRNIVKKLEAYEAEKDDINEQIKNIYKEAATHGYHVSALKTILRLKRKDQEKLREEEELIGSYRDVLGF